MAVQARDHKGLLLEVAVMASQRRRGWLECVSLIPTRADAQPVRGIAALMQCCSLHGRPRTVASAATTVELSGLRSPVSPPGEAYTHTPMVGRRASTPDFCLLAPAPRHLQPAAEKLFRWK